MKIYKRFILSSLFILLSFSMFSQEMVAPLQTNPYLTNVDRKTAKDKKTRASLPFIEDFSYSGPYPDDAVWQDKQAYINNTMCDLPVNRGVATLDGLNEFGRPYFVSPFSSGTADSLTCKPIDLSSYVPNDNLYFSFYYQPQGLGFAPENNDSLFLYFKNNTGDWVRIWETRGTPLQSFQIKIFPIADVQFLHTDFQFRFVNIASLNTNDDIWNIDYIKIDANRSPSDSLMKDVGFTKEPGSILSNYTSMPYRHFKANISNELSPNQLVELRNTHNISQNITVNHAATELFSATPISSFTLPSVSIGAKSLLTQNNPSFNITYNAPNNFSKVIIENKYFINSIAGDRKKNDTIIRETVFDNYFAYDDGSAEKSYFLLPAANFPSKTALEFTLNEPDSVRGVMVHFGAQLPTAFGKFFSVVLYKKLHDLGNTDTIIYQQDLYKVMYEPAINGFSTYAFDTPQFLSAGKYYIGITQPANFGSDSIYYGLDVNNNTNIQHLFYNVDGSWYASGVQGSIMMRPITGLQFTPTSVPTAEIKTSISIYPNPTQDMLYINTDDEKVNGALYDMNGMLVAKLIAGSKRISLQSLSAGMYILVLQDKNEHFTSHKIIKK